MEYTFIHSEKYPTVKQVPQDMQFISDSQDVTEINRHFGIESGEFDSYFVYVDGGDYVQVFGMEGIVPYLYKPVWLIVSVNQLYNFRVIITGQILYYYNPEMVKLNYNKEV